MGQFISKVAGDSLDTIHDLIKHIKIPPMPSDPTCHPESVQVDELMFGAHSLQQFVTNQDVTFTIPPLCKSLSDETKGWLKSFDLWDFAVEGFRVNDFTFDMLPPGSSDNPSHSSVLLKTQVSGINGKVSAAFRLKAWGLGTVQGRLTVTLQNFGAGVDFPVEHHLSASRQDAKLPKEGRRCFFSSNDDAMEIDFDMDTWHFGIFSAAETAIDYFMHSPWILDLICQKAIPNKLSELMGAVESLGR